MSKSYNNAPRLTEKVILDVALLFTRCPAPPLPFTILDRWALVIGELKRAISRSLHDPFLPEKRVFDMNDNRVRRLIRNAMHDAEDALVVQFAAYPTQHFAMLFAATGPYFSHRFAWRPKWQHRRLFFASVGSIKAGGVEDQEGDGHDDESPMECDGEPPHARIELVPGWHPVQSVHTPGAMMRLAEHIHEAVRIATSLTPDWMYGV